MTHRLGRLLLITAANIGIWMLAGLFATSEFYRRSIVMGGVAPWDQVLDVQICSALVWAFFTPFVVLIAQALPLRAPHRLRNGIVIAALLPLLAIFRAAFGGAVLNLGEHEPIALQMIRLSIGIRTHRDIAILSAIFFVSNLVDAQREAVRRERQRVRAQTLLARTELDELRTRLQPRFALRMLRHIGSVLRDDPRAADALIVSLSAILRRSMAHETDEQIPLADELEHFDRCLDLCRAGGRFQLATRYVANEELLACRVPALALQPALEAVVLDLTAGSGGSVEVRCTREGTETRIDVCSIATPSGSTVNSSVRIPYQEAAA